MLVVADVLRTREQHVLEQVSETRPSRPLVFGADVIPEVDRHQRRGVVLVQNDVEAVI